MGRERGMPATVALLVIGGFLAALGWLLVRQEPVPEAAGPLLETLKAGFLLAVGYYLGSSAGSASKEALLAPPAPDDDRT